MVTLKELRKSHNMTCQDVANAAGITRVTISRLENGVSKQPLIETAEKIANVFGLHASDIDWIIKKEGKENGN